ncbi:BMC domain-containing protein [Micromonospora sp. Llam7]|uniref:BMC domain-containing protein n=1 Tax=Micromonospora tarapacensis TaxID=2835305 RepID=UPI001C83BB20|nr:BMC domain-containing protein [Micromonospora tarapacensis]MBX7268190.1 BMC domain-containing protein [Micromonospora tarapacensis]
MDNALGTLETRGFTAAIAGMDAMVKAAEVEIVRVEQIGSAYVTVLLRGDVASVKAAIDAGAEAATRHGEVISVNVIASPYRSTADALGLARNAA